MGIAPPFADFGSLSRGGQYPWFSDYRPPGQFRDVFDPPPPVPGDENRARLRRNFNLRAGGTGPPQAKKTTIWELFYVGNTFQNALQGGVFCVKRI